MRYLCESALLCSAICYLVNPLSCFCMYVRSKWKIEISEVIRCKMWWIKWKSCDKNINKRKTSAAGVEQAKEKNGRSLKWLTEHCVTNHKWNHSLPLIHLDLPLLIFVTQLMIKTLKMVFFFLLYLNGYLYFFSFPFQYLSICPCLIPRRGVGALFHSS